MKNLRFLRLIGLLTLLPLTGHGQVLYDGGLGTLEAQGWSGVALLINTPWVPQNLDDFSSLEDAGYRLDTTSDDYLYAGNRLTGLPLNADQGYTLSFELEILDENHSDINRAGYSVLVVSNDPTRSLELAFWEDEIWPYDYVQGTGEDFLHGSGTSVITTARTTYTLEVLGSGYTLSANAVELFSGQLQDYTPREFPFAELDPYETPNSLVFSDNTSRGASVTRLYRVELTVEPPSGVFSDSFEAE